MKIIKALTQFDVGGIELDLFNFGGIVARGLYAALGSILSLLFSFLIVVWIGLSIFAAIKIIVSQANPEGIESGMTTIKNIWSGIAMGLGFFLIISLLGVFLGFGSVYEWSKNLAQCGGSGGPFLYQVADGEVVQGLKDGGSTKVFVGCCKELSITVPILGTLTFLKEGEWNVYDVSSIPISPSFQSAINDYCPVNTFVNFDQ